MKKLLKTPITGIALLTAGLVVGIASSKKVVEGAKSGFVQGWKAAFRVAGVDKDEKR